MWQAGSFQPDAHQFQAEGFLVRLRPITDRDGAILDGEIVLSDDIRLTQDINVSSDADLRGRADETLPAGRLQLDEGVVQVKSDKVQGTWSNECSHNREGNTTHDPDCCADIQEATYTVESATMKEDESAMVEIGPTEVDASLDVARLGSRIRSLRGTQNLSLDEAAQRSGVSRSMLSAVERGEKTPTVLVLHRIAVGLGSNITRLLGEEQAASVVVLRRAAQDVARDPSGWERRNLAPAQPGVAFEFMRTTIPPGVNAGEFPPHPPGSREYVAVEQGTLQLTVAGAMYLLETGDSITYHGDCWHAFANPGPDGCVYYLALEAPKHHEPQHGRSPQETSHG